MKRVFIIHGWDGYPEKNWFPWLKRELETRGFEVQVPALPDTANPRIEKWVPAVAKVVGIPDEETYFVGHSMGCQTIVRYLETLPEEVKVGGVVFVAGFFRKITNLEEEPDVQETASHWLNTPVDLTKAKKHFNKSVAIFSDNDEYVSLDNVDDFRDKLGSKIIIEHNKGHLNERAGVTELPVVLEELLKMAKLN